MTYQESLDYLNNFVNYEKIPIPHASTGVFNLGRVLEFLARLGSPQKDYPSIVIAGTKGKGSTAVLIASTLQAAHYRTGLYTQPHLHNYRERMRVNGEMISEAEMVALVEEIRPAVESMLSETARLGVLTSYEVATGLTLLFFARQKVDFAVLEIGLGGRLDAVNVVEPVVSVITSLSLDHMAVLGNTIEEIAYEKAGIIKPQIPVITGPQWPAAEPVLKKVAQEQGAPLTQVQPAPLTDPLAPLDSTHRVRHSQRIGITFGPQTVELDLSLLGEHQRLNATLAAEALWQQQNQPGGLPLTPADLQTGFSKVEWPARLQILQDQPGYSLVVADGAHNAESAARLRQALSDNFYFERLWLVAGAYRDKDIAGIFGELSQEPVPAGLVLTRSRNSRAIEPATLAEEIADIWPTEIALSHSVRAGLAKARLLAGPHDLICLTGSLSVAAEAEEVFNARLATAH